MKTINQTIATIFCITLIQLSSQTALAGEGGSNGGNAWDGVMAEDHLISREKLQDFPAFEKFIEQMLKDQDPVEIITNESKDYFQCVKEIAPYIGGMTTNLDSNRIIFYSAKHLPDVGFCTNGIPFETKQIGIPVGKNEVYVDLKELAKLKTKKQRFIFYAHEYYMWAIKTNPKYAADTCEVRQGLHSDVRNLTTHLMRCYSQYKNHYWYY